GDGAEPPLLRRLPQRAVSVAVAVLENARQADAVLLRRPDHPVDAVEFDFQRLLADDVLAGVHRLQRWIEVFATGRGEMDDVNLRSLAQHLREAVEDGHAGPAVLFERGAG